MARKNLLATARVLIETTRAHLRSTLETAFEVDAGAFDTAGLEAALIEHGRRAQEIAQDGDRSAAGKARAQARADAELSAVTAAWVNANAGALERSRSGQLTALEKAVIPSEPLTEIGRLHRLLRDHFILERLGTLDQLQASMVYREAGEEVQGAMRRAPQQITVSKAGGVRVAPFVPADVVAEVAAAKAEVANPKGAAMVRDLDRLIQAHRSVADTILSGLREGGLLPGDHDPIAEAARG